MEKKDDSFWSIPKDVEKYGGTFFVAKKMAQLNRLSIIGRWRKTSNNFKRAGMFRKIILIPYYLFDIIVWTLTRVVLNVVNPFFRILIAAILLVTVPIGVDQAWYPSFPVNKVFTEISNKDLGENEKVILLFKAATYQLRQELDSSVGWTPNDHYLNPDKLLDNRLNRQARVQFTTYKAVQALSGITTNYGANSDENPHTLKAAQLLAYPVDKWGWGGMMEGSSEENYRDALVELDKFYEEAKQATKEGKVIVDVRSDDFYSIIGIFVDGNKRGILTQSYGELGKTSSDVAWSEIDDIVYKAQGTAIVARDIAATIRSCFSQEIDRGGLDVFNEAYSQLNSAANYNPYVVFKGDGKSWYSKAAPDVRAKMFRYFSIAFERFKGVMESLAK